MSSVMPVPRLQPVMQESEPLSSGQPHSNKFRPITTAFRGGLG